MAEPESLLDDLLGRHKAYPGITQPWHVEDDGDWRRGIKVAIPDGSSVLYVPTRALAEYIVAEHNSIPALFSAARIIWSEQ